MHSVSLNVMSLSTTQVYFVVDAAAAALFGEVPRLRGVVCRYRRLLSSSTTFVHIYDMSLSTTQVPASDRRALACIYLYIYIYIYIYTVSLAPGAWIEEPSFLIHSFNVCRYLRPTGYVPLSTADTADAVIYGGLHAVTYGGSYVAMAIWRKVCQFDIVPARIIFSGVRG